MEVPDATQPTALDQEAIAARLRLFISKVGEDQTVFSERIGIPYRTVRGYVTASRVPSPEFLVAANRVYSLNPIWLLTGAGQQLLDAGMPAPVSTVAAPTVSLADSFAVIPVLPIEAAAGAGAVNEPAPTSYVVDGLCFSRRWLASAGLKADSLRVIDIRGGSMEPVLSDGDKVLVNMADTSPRSGFVYVLRQGDELLVKYCQLLPGGKLHVSSANPTYPAYDVDLHYSPDTQIIGRVVASMHQW